MQGLCYCVPALDSLHSATFCGECSGSRKKDLSLYMRRVVWKSWNGVGKTDVGFNVNPDMEVMALVYSLWEFSS